MKNRYVARDGSRPPYGRMWRTWVVVDTTKPVGHPGHIADTRANRDEARLRADFLNTYRSDAE